MRGRLVIAETRHFAAVLFATGDVQLDEGDGRGKTRFPPESMRLAFMAFLVELHKYTKTYSFGDLQVAPLSTLEKHREA